MGILREWMHRFWGTLRPGRRDHELAEELRLHLELASEDARRRGASEDTVRAARMRVGGMSQAMAALRDQRGLPALAGVIQDFRHAQRMLRKAPWFAAITVLTLAVGIGATATVFSAVDALLVRPLAVVAPQELFVIRQVGEPRARFAFDFYKSLSESKSVFSDMLASFTFPVTLVDSGTGTHARAAFVTPNYFELLGVPPFLGRLFHDEGGGAVAVISHRFWKERFGGRQSVVGQLVRIGGSPFVIGGVTPPAFGGLQLDIALDLWIPMSGLQGAVPIPSFHPAVDIVGRVAAGLSPTAATVHASTEYERWMNSTAPMSARREARPLVLVPASHGLASAVRETFRTSLGLLVGICACLWVITIVNVSGLLTARLRERSREIGLRLALGVTSARLFIQLLAEGIMLVLGGLVLGLLVTTGLVAAIPRWIPSWAGVDIRASPLVIIATVITASLATIILAIVQILSVDHRRLVSHLAPDLVRCGGGQRFRFSTCLVTAQLALTVPLIVAASLLAQSLHRLGNVDTGFARSNLLQLEIEPVLVGYSAERARAYYAALIERLRAVPGISDASVSSGGALSGYDGTDRVRNDGVWQEVRAIAVDERYFSTMGIRMVSGRPFDASEVQRRATVVIVNDALARRLFGRGETAIGRVVTFNRGSTSEPRIIVGMAENTADATLRDRWTPTVYLPSGESSLLMVHVRTMTDPAGLIAAVRGTATSLDPNVPISGIETIESRRHEALQRERLLAGTSGVIGWLALVVSAIGLFARISHDVATRTREIGIRSALGATRSQIGSLFLKDTATILMFSAVFGTGAAFAGARVMQGLLYGISATGLTAYVAAMCLLVVAATAATMLPLRRVLRAAVRTNLLHD